MSDKDESRHIDDEGRSRRGAERPVRIYAFVQAYPTAFKPYYDTHFADLVRRGYDLSLFAAHRPRETAFQNALPRETRYFGTTSGILRRIPAAVVGAIRDRERAFAVASTIVGGIHRRKLTLGAAARLVSLPLQAPDLCVVHGLRTLVNLRGLGDIYATKVALYYHGGEPAEAGNLPDAAVASAFREADVIFTNTDASRREAITRGADASKIHVVPVGFDPSEYPNLPRRHRRRPGRLAFLSVGRLSAGKGHADAIEALALLEGAGIDSFEYTVIGDGPLRSALEELVHRLSLSDRVRFRGALSHKDVVQELARADALILPSKPAGNWAETQATVVQEALLMKTFPIVTLTGGVPESIPPEFLAFAVSPDRPDALKSALERFALLNEPTLQGMVERGRSWVLRRYRISETNTRLLELAMMNGTVAHVGQGR